MGLLEKKKNDSIQKNVTGVNGAVTKCDMLTHLLC